MAVLEGALGPKDVWNDIKLSEYARVKVNIMLIISIFIIAVGILFDVIDFTLRAVSALKRERVPSATPVIGFIVVTLGLVGLKIFSDWMSTTTLILCIFLAGLFELFLQIMLPLFFTLLCNVIYKRRLFDMTTLPNKHVDNNTT